MHNRPKIPEAPKTNLSDPYNVLHYLNPIRMKQAELMNKAENASVETFVREVFAQVVDEIKGFSKANNFGEGKDKKVFHEVVRSVFQRRIEDKGNVSIRAALMNVYEGLFGPYEVKKEAEAKRGDVISNPQRVLILPTPAKKDDNVPQPGARLKKG